MGVDYYSCNCCGDTFPDAGYFVGCECGNRWCSDRCAEVDGYRDEEEGYIPEGEDWAQDTSCKYCRNEDYDNDELLYFALSLLGKSRQQLVDMKIKNDKNDS